MSMSIDVTSLLNAVIGVLVTAIQSIQPYIPLLVLVGAFGGILYIIFRYTGIGSLLGRFMGGD